MLLMDMLHTHLDSSHQELHFSICKIARFYLFHFINEQVVLFVFLKKKTISRKIINMERFIENQVSYQSL